MMMALYHFWALMTYNSRVPRLSLGFSPPVEICAVLAHQSGCREPIVQDLLSAFSLSRPLPSTKRSRVDATMELISQDILLS